MAPAREEPWSADELWSHLEDCSVRERRLLIEDLEEYWRWDLCLRVAAESEKAAPDRPQEALDLAELALSIAERLPGKEAFRLRLQTFRDRSRMQRGCGSPG